MEKPATPPAAAPLEKPAEKAATPPAAAPATSPADDLFGPSPTEEPKSGKETTTKKPETPATPEAKPADKPAAPAEEKQPANGQKKDEKPKTEEKDPLFGAAPSILHEAGGLASNEMRLWTDNTGNFTCQARLIRFTDGQVRLLKDNGHTTTVSLARLSTGDLEFVNRQASAQRAEVGKTAQAPVSMPSFAN
jgi:hypothetical protein